MAIAFFTVLYMLFLMSYSGSMFVQIGYWLLETYFIDGINDLMFSRQLNLIRRQYISRDNNL
jgi:hypothetical protein